MVNQQLADYVKQQVQGGVQKDAIKKALLDAGWPAADVEDSINATGATAPAGAAVQTINPSAAMGGNQAGGQMAQPTSKGATFFSSEPKAAEPKKSGGKIGMIIMGFIILVLLGLSGYLYWTSRSSAPVAATGGGGTDESSLNAQIQQLTTDKDSLTGQLSALTLASQEANDELAFFSTSTASTTVKGTLSGAPGSFVVTTPRGIQVMLKYTAKQAAAESMTKAFVGKPVIATGSRKAGTLELWNVTVILQPGLLTGGAQPGATSTTSSTSPAPVPAPAPAAGATAPPPTSSSPLAPTGTSATTTATPPPATPPPAAH